MGMPFLLGLNYTTGLGLDFRKEITPNYRFQKVNYGLFRDATTTNILEENYFLFEKELEDHKKNVLLGRCLFFKRR